MPGLADLDAVELRRLLDDGETSATEVMEAHLARIASVNDRLNAIVTLDAEGALTSARPADAPPPRPRRGRSSALGAARPPVRAADRGQGSGRHGGYANHLRLADLPRPHAD